MRKERENRRPPGVPQRRADSPHRRGGSRHPNPGRAAELARARSRQAEGERRAQGGHPSDGEARPGEGALPVHAGVRRVEAPRGARRRVDLFAHLSHEIRNPLNVILGMSEILLQDNPGPEVEEGLSLIRQSGGELLAFVDGVQEFSRVDAGEVELEPCETDLVEFALGLLQVFEEGAAAAGIVIENEFSPEIPRRASLDPGRVSQVLVNLLELGLTSAAAGRLALRWRRLGSRCGRVLLECRVEGFAPGFAPPALTCSPADLYCNWVQRGSAAAAAEGGLDLALCRRLAELMGGSLEVGCAPGGTAALVFRFEVDAVAERGCGDGPQGSPPPWAEEAPAVSRGDANLLRVLVVDDNELNRAITRLMLDELGLESEEASSGAEAIERLVEDVFDLVLMDLQMPDMDGLEASREIIDRGSPGHPAPPIIALTADPNREVREACRRSGLVDYLPKPLRAELMTEVLARHTRPLDN